MRMLWPVVHILNKKTAKIGKIQLPPWHGPGVQLISVTLNNLTQLEGIGGDYLIWNDKELCWNNNVKLHVHDKVVLNYAQLNAGEAAKIAVKSLAERVTALEEKFDKFLASYAKRNNFYGRL